ncbi:MAG: FAD-dependent oxidoreductase [Bdellovibrionales bacterium]|nr:FAD-dependent oxidoreductase [Bdellovibrionales bacterium]
MQGPSADIGHILRGDHSQVPPPSSEEKIPIAIIGGGVSGLSAAWHLHDFKFKDFKLFELDHEVGGTSAFGENSVSRFPWGAHYLPIPAQESVELRRLLEELGVITGYENGLPIYKEEYLCAEPQDRLLFNGKWRRGSVPEAGWSDQDRDQTYAFIREMLRLRLVMGSDGKPMFGIPLEKSSEDMIARRLDTISMKEYLLENSWTSSRLHWWINFCCRDDFGTAYDQTSAWAGIHYFAARGGEASKKRGEAFLTWPEGNGWLVKRMREKSADQIHTRALVTNVKPTESGADVEVFYPDEKKTIRYKAGAVVFAGPRFVAAKVIEPWRKDPPAHIQAFQYTPWMVANITLHGVPKSSGFDDAPLCWDNNSFESDSMGYVVATHQMRLKGEHDTVLTLYWALDKESPQETRKKARQRSHAEWSAIVVEDLEKMHPGIRSQIRSVDVCVWGHGMIRCPPGFMWGEHRLEALKPLGNIFFSHSDLSGMCLFEEAHFHGYTSAAKALEAIKRG